MGNRASVIGSVDERRSGSNIPPPISRRELVLIGLVISIGILLRAIAVSRSAVEQFDEGVYASNIYFGPPEYAYPQQRFYAPPLLPALIEAGMIAGLPPNLAALLPSFLAGCGTIGAVWWFGRNWFGPAAGLSAATLLAMSDFHTLLSASALTDALLGLWLILAVDAAARSLLTLDFRWAVGAGVYTSLAWWTKYNGWLPLAIEAAALPLLWLVLRPDRKRTASWVACLGLTAATAAAVWCPYYFALQASGGYGPIAANHAKYVVGFAGWLDAAARQLSNHQAVETPLTALGVCLAVVLPGFLYQQSPWRRAGRLVAGGIFGALALVCSGFLTIGLAAVWGMLQAAVALRGQQATPGEQDGRRIGLVLLIVWWCGLLVATPLYMAYPRLTLPWLLAAVLGAGLGSDEEFGGWRFGLSRRWQLAAGGLMLVAGLAVAFLLPPRNDALRGLPDRRGVQRIARQIHAASDSRSGRVIYVYGEPAMFFQLRSGGEEFVAPVASLPTAAAAIEGLPTYLLAGPHARRDPAFNEQLANTKAWRRIERYDDQPSALVWLDLHDPRTTKPSAVASEHAFELYELVP